MFFRFLIFLFLLGGCASKSYFYPQLQPPKLLFPKLDKRVGVKVKLPQYLILGEIAYKKDSKLHFVKGLYLVEDPRKFFQNSIKDYLKSVLHCEAFNFPWEATTIPECLLEVEVEDFYYDKDNSSGILKSSVKINQKEYIVSIKQPDAGGIVPTLKRVYEVFLYQIAKLVDKSCR
ncbi:MAG: hypothetical protein GXO61_06175 [Epsilonproteobacteria bacterium]|nr:hypothetical protein [Campylobacterota bacterium]